MRIPSRLALLPLLALLAACSSSSISSLPSLLPSFSPSAPAAPSPLAVAPAAPGPLMVTNPRTSAASFQAGISLLLYGNDVSYQRESQPVFDQLATDNVNSIVMVFPIFQSGCHATDIHADPTQTPSDAELSWLVSSARARGFSVMLRPLVDERSMGTCEWRGGMWPNPVSGWFANYDALMVHYARLGQASGAFALDIGSELDTMEIYTYYWPRLISQLRSVYSGQLTYSSNFEARPISFGYLLDFISVDAYYRITSVIDPTVAEITAGWASSGIPDMEHRMAYSGKRIVATEIGVVPANGVFRVTYGGSSYPYNPLAQQHFYAGTCAALKPIVSGFYWWEVGLTQQSLPSSGFDPLSVPGTDQAISDCYAPAFTPPPPLTPFQRHHLLADA